MTMTTTPTTTNSNNDKADIIKNHATQLALEMCELMVNPNNRADDFQWLEYEDHVAKMAADAVPSLFPEGQQINVAMKELAQITAVIVFRDYVHARYPEEGAKFYAAHLEPEPTPEVPAPSVVTPPDDLTVKGQEGLQAVVDSFLPAQGTSSGSEKP